MKKYQICLILLLYLLPLHSEEIKSPYTSIQAGAFSSHSYSYLAGGLGIYFDYTRYMSFGYRFFLGKTEQKGFYCYSGFPQVLTYYGFAHLKPDRMGVIILIFAMVIPERFNFHIPINDKSRAGVYLSPYGFDYIKYRQPFSEQYGITCEFGLQYSYRFADHMKISPSIGYKTSYNSDHKGITFEIAVQFDGGK